MFFDKIHSSVSAYLPATGFMAQKLRLLMAQFNPTVGAIDANLEKILHLIHAHQDTHDLIVFPELALTGYPPEDLLLRPFFQTEVMNALQTIAQASKQCHVIIGHPSFIADQCFNSATLFYQQKQAALYHKQALPNYGVFDEARYFTPGPETACVFTIKGYQLGLCICEDLWEEASIAPYLSSSLHSLISINASPFDKEKYLKRLHLLTKHSQQGLNIIYLNTVGGQDELLFDGQSLVMNQKGELKARLNAFIEEEQTIVIDSDTIKAQVAPLLPQDALLYQALVYGTQQYVEKNHFPGVLVGLSGGIDSALTLAIAVDALGASRVQAVMMPSRYTASMSLEDASLQIEALQVDSLLLPIEPSLEAILNTIKPAFSSQSEDSTEENIQARIRGLFLMALSNKTGKMVLVTSNKSETAVGYATLYGDMAGGFAVLKDVLKTEVYALANYRNSLSFIIPERVLTRAPSAELAFQQTDQDSLPDYPTLDAIIRFYVEQNVDADAIIAKGFNAEQVLQVTHLIQRNEYKRRQAAPGIKVSSRAFGRDWRMPITSGFKQSRKNPSK